jgi:hypothetical protein
LSGEHCTYWKRRFESVHCVPLSSDTSSSTAPTVEAGGATHTISLSLRTSAGTTVSPKRHTAPGTSAKRPPSPTRTRMLVPPAVVPNTGEKEAMEYVTISAHTERVHWS